MWGVSAQGAVARHSKHTNGFPRLKKFHLRCLLLLILFYHFSIINGYYSSLRYLPPTEEIEEVNNHSFHFTLTVC